MPLKYCLDTSLFINAWQKYYRIDVFPTFWTNLDSLIREGLITSCWNVYEEIRVQGDELHTWVKKHELIFEKPTASTTKQMVAVMGKFPNFAAASGSKNGADPWVICHAMTTGTALVTDEQYNEKTKPTKPPKIPNVCDAMGIRWHSPLDFLADAGVCI